MLNDLSDDEWFDCYDDVTEQEPSRGRFDSPTTSTSYADTSSSSTISESGGSSTSVDAAHLAAFENDDENLRALLSNLDLKHWTRLDKQGNTILHVAVLRKHRRIVATLIELGFPLDVRNERGWTALDEAISLSDFELVKLLYVEKLQALKLEKKLKKVALSKNLLEMPDYSMQIRWELGSPMFGMLLRHYGPHDTYRIWKCGAYIRVDGTLKGLEIDENSTKKIPDWKRGHFSLIFDASTSPSTLLLLDRKRGTYIDLAAKLKEDKAHIDEEVLLLISEGAGKTKFKTSEVNFKPVKSWLGYETTEKVEGWNTKLYECTGKMMALTYSKAPLLIPASATYDDYLALKADDDGVDELPLDPVSLTMQTSKSSKDREEKHGEKEKTSKRAPRKISGKCWMAEDFPMSLQQLLPLLDVVGNANKHIGKVAKFLQKYGDRQLFPVKMQIPLIFTVYLLVCFAHFEVLPPDSEARTAEFYQVPSDFIQRDTSIRKKKSNKKKMLAASSSSYASSYYAGSCAAECSSCGGDGGGGC